MARDPDGACRLLAKLAQGRKLGVDLLKPRTQRVQQAFARLGRRDAARGAGQQPETKPFLKPADGVAERRLRNAELRCCPGETALLRDRQEDKKIVEVPSLAFMMPHSLCASSIESIGGQAK